MDTQRSYVTYPKSHSTLGAAVDSTLTPLTLSSVPPPAATQPLPGLRSSGGLWEWEIDKKGVKLFRAKGGEQERRKGKKKGGERRQRIWVGETKKREFTPKADDILTVKEHILPKEEEF